MGEERTGFGYGNASFAGNQNPHLVGFDTAAPEIYNLTSGMEMIGFQSKQGEPTAVMWKELFSKASGQEAAVVEGAAYHGGGSQSSGKDTLNEPSSSEFYHHDFRGIPDPNNETLIGSPPPWHHHQQQNSGRAFIAGDDHSLTSCVFPCEGNERPSQGLSLSLSSSNPSAIGLQHFELRQDLRFGASSSRSLNPPPLQPHAFQTHPVLKNSRYLSPAQELLNEFCSLNTKEITENSLKLKGQKPIEHQEEIIIKKQSLYSLDLLELQRRKTKLLQMLVEVDRRYKYYCDQMRGVVSSFEMVAGTGAATVYLAMASKAMSRHFRCLRDGIASQIRATKKAIGDKDSAAPGTTKGETPRLRLLDQTLRQQRALQQMSLMDSHPWRPQRGLPERAVSVLRAWLFEHFLHPYPCDVDKHILARQTGLSRSQVSNWFINARVRLWKPMVEEMYLEELKENEAMAASENGSRGGNIDFQNPQRIEDQKPTQDQLVRIDSECLTSIIGSHEKNDLRKNKGILNEQQAFINSYNAMELDWQHSTTAVPYINAASGGAIGFQNNGGGGVSLTLGLHQHGGASTGMGFSSAAAQSSLFYGRDQIEECQTEQYSLLDSENQTLPYRNLMGAQLLHDLAG